jgi:Terminase small subunit
MAPTNDGEQRYRTIDELVAIAFANILDYVDFGPQDVTVKDLSRLTPAQRAAVAVASDIHIRLHDKVAALSELAKRLGMYGKLTRDWHELREVLDALDDAEVATHH